MRSSDLTFAAAALQDLLRQRGKYEHVRVRPRAGHLNIEAANADGQPSLVARVTPLGGVDYGLSFRSSGGRWEPMPVSGPLEEIADGVTGLLGPYLDPANLR
ncbi:MAG TPA: hypothetical protein VK573_00105 [Gemmatimonadales bacterium]|nr:hypothetical protein [Gemmatimonadales bacterium]